MPCLLSRRLGLARCRLVRRFAERRHLDGDADLYVGNGHVVEADYDNDGDADLLVTNVRGPAILLQNRAGDGASWIGIDLRRGPNGSRPEGARVEVVAERRTLIQEVHSDGSYLAAHDRRLRFGLGARREPVVVRVRWCGDESTVTYADLAPNRYHVLPAPER